MAEKKSNLWKYISRAGALVGLVASGWALSSAAAGTVSNQFNWSIVGFRIHEFKNGKIHNLLKLSISNKMTFDITVNNPNLTAYIKASNGQFQSIAQTPPSLKPITVPANDVKTVEIPLKSSLQSLASFLISNGLLSFNNISAKGVASAIFNTPVKVEGTVSVANQPIQVSKVISGAQKSNEIGGLHGKIKTSGIEALNPN